MSVVPGFKCDSCKTACDNPHDATFCGDCWTDKVSRIKELEREVYDRECERDEAIAQLELEAEVFAAQIREKDKLINELLAKVHAA